VVIGRKLTQNMVPAGPGISEFGWTPILRKKEQGSSVEITAAGKGRGGVRKTGGRVELKTRFDGGCGRTTARTHAVDLRATWR